MSVVTERSGIIETNREPNANIAFFTDFDPPVDTCISFVHPGGSEGRGAVLIPHKINFYRLLRGRHVPLNGSGLRLGTLIVIRYAPEKNFKHHYYCRIKPRFKDWKKNRPKIRACEHAFSAELI